MSKQQRDLSKENWGLLGCVNYFGNLVWRNQDGGYTMWGKKFASQEELDKAIDQSCEIINKSITVVNTGTISCTNEGS